MASKPPYSTFLMGGSSGGGDETVLYAGNAPETIIVQWISLYSNPLLVAQFFVETGDDHRTLEYRSWTGPDNPASHQIQIKHVVQLNFVGQEVLRIRSTDEPVDYSISGVVLQGIASG